MQCRPIEQDPQLELLPWESCSKELQISRRLHGDHIGGPVLLSRHFAEKAVNRAFLQHACVHRPIRENIAQNQISRTIPQLLHFADELAKENCRRVEKNQIARMLAQKCFRRSEEHTSELQSPVHL